MDESRHNSTVRYVAASFTMVLVIFSCTLNGFLGVVFIKGRQNFEKQRTFAIITSQMLVCDYFSLIVMIFVAVPVSFVGSNFYPLTITHIIMSFDTLAFNGALMFAFLLTLDRIFLFLFPKPHAKIFQTQYLYIIIFLMWAVIFGYLACLTFSGCVKEFQFRVARICQPDMIMYWSVVTAINTYYGSVLPLLILSLYVVIYGYIKSRKFKLVKMLVGQPLGNQTAFKTRELSILLQSATICTMFEVEHLIFEYVPKLTVDSPNIRFLLNFAQTWSIILLHMSQAFIIFLFNTTAKEELHRLICLNLSPMSFSTTSQQNFVVRQHG